NNAGINVLNRRLDEITAADWDYILAVNLTGAFNMVQAALPTMRAQKDGLIINVASTAAKRVSGVAGICYSASKFGMLGMSLALGSLELRRPRLLPLPGRRQHAHHGAP